MKHITELLTFKRHRLDEQDKSTGIDKDFNLFSIRRSVKVSGGNWENGLVTAKFCLTLIVVNVSLSQSINIMLKKAFGCFFQLRFALRKKV